MSLLIENYANVVAAVNQTTAPLTGSTRISGAVFAPVARFDANETVEVASSDYIVVATYAGEVTFNLPAPADNTGRLLVLRSDTGNSIFSSVSNVLVPGSSTPTDELAYDEPQAWVQIQSDGTNWVIISGYAQGYA